MFICNISSWLEDLCYQTRPTSQANRYIHESWFDEMSICLSIKKSQSDPKIPHSATEWPQNDPKWPIMSSQMLEACMSCFLFEKYSLPFRSRHEKVRSQSCCYISLCNPNDGLQISVYPFFYNICTYFRLRPNTFHNRVSSSEVEEKVFIQKRDFKIEDQERRMYRLLLGSVNIFLNILFVTSELTFQVLQNASI